MTGGSDESLVGNLRLYFHIDIFLPRGNNKNND